MTKNVIQIRMPEKLAREIEGLVRRGLYKNKSEVVIDAVRHFLGNREKSDIASFIEGQLIGKGEKTVYTKKELDDLWDKVKKSDEWKKRFGDSADEVMGTLRAGR